MIKSAFVALPLVVALTGCVSHPKLTWQDSQKEAYSTDVPDDRSSVVFYRLADAVEGPAVNVYVNGQYAASLLPNAYRQEFVCAQNQKFLAEFTHNDSGYRKKANDGAYYNLPEGAVSFFRVVNDGHGNPVLEAVSPERAEQDMKNVRRQSNTLSRVAKATQCAQILKKYSIQASALFQFDRSAYVDMLPKGKQEVEAIAADIKQNPNHISSISVVGYTDPEGKPEYNQKLSYNRALTVKNKLAAGGVDGRLIEAEGRGEQDLVVTDCRKQYPRNAVARKQCDQPNRRVEIVLRGEKAE